MSDRPSYRYLTTTLPKAILDSFLKRTPSAWRAPKFRPGGRFDLALANTWYVVSVQITTAPAEARSDFLRFSIFRDNLPVKTSDVDTFNFLLGGAWSLWTGDLKTDVANFWRLAKPLLEEAEAKSVSQPGYRWGHDE